MTRSVSIECIVMFYIEYLCNYCLKVNKVENKSFFFSRTDKEKNSYTGALCGLGFDPRTGEAMYQDHDVEIEFDIEITLKDICDVSMKFYSDF